MLRDETEANGFIEVPSKQSDSQTNRPTIRCKAVRPCQAKVRVSGVLTVNSPWKTSRLPYRCGSGRGEQNSQLVLYHQGGDVLPELERVRSVRIVNPLLSPSSAVMGTPKMKRTSVDSPGPKEEIS